MNKHMLSLPVAMVVGAVMLISTPLMAQTAAPETISDSAERQADVSSPDARQVQGAADEEAVLAQVKQRLVDKIPQFSVAQITVSSIPGLFEVVADGLVYYVDESGDYLIDGNLIRLSDRANLTEARLGKIQMKFIDDIDEKDMLIYEPEGEPTGSLTVFTDISCGYCRKLHEELDTLLDAGVRVRYLLFPRAGLGSQGHKDLISVWCADNPQAAMTIAKAGGKIEPATCDNPIEMHVELAQKLGLRGTPLMFTSGGEKIPGYRPAEELATLITETETAPQ